MPFVMEKTLWMARTPGQNRGGQHREKVHEVSHKRHFQLTKHQSSMGFFDHGRGSSVEVVVRRSQPLCAPVAPNCKPIKGNTYMLARIAF